MNVLVTGASGFLGRHLVHALVARGDRVRALVRSRERGEPLRASGAEIRLGDLTDPGTLTGVADGIDVIHHLGSAMGGSWSAFEAVDVEGTRRLLGEATRAQVRRLVYAGTLHNYPLAKLADGARVDETVPLDTTGLLGPYARAKQQAESLVLGANRAGGLEGVIVRPGLVCGDGTSIFPAHVGRPTAGGVFIMFGDGGVPLPLIYVDNAIDALVLGGTVEGIAGESFNVVDDEVITQREYLDLLVRNSGRQLRIVRLPRAAYFGIGLAAEMAARVTGKPPATNRYRVRARFRRVRWDTTKAKKLLGWRSRVPLRDGLVKAFRAAGAQS
jgi:nucleoside-diphosphate-sugar epimerase